MRLALVTLAISFVSKMLSIPRTRMLNLEKENRERNQPLFELVKEERKEKRGVEGGHTFIK